MFEKNKIKQLIQAYYNIDDTETVKREVESLNYACKRLSVKEGTFITFDSYENDIVEDDIKIEFLPAWKFVLENGNI